MTLRRALAVLAASCAVLALALGSSKPSTPRLDVVQLAGDIEHETDHVSATQLAEWIRARKPGLKVIDVRSDSAFNDFHIPSAERVALSALTTLKPAAGETIVLYSDGGAHAAQAWVLLRSLGHQQVFFLRGGLLDWMDDVMNPVLPERSGNAAADSVTEHHSALSKYFGGVPRTGAVPLPQQQDAGAVIARTKRRGC
jgi:rhodanese-related sulfurtransferase